MCGKKGNEKKPSLRRPGRQKKTRQSSRVNVIPAVRMGIQMVMIGQKKKMQAKGQRPEIAQTKIEELEYKSSSQILSF